VSVICNAFYIPTRDAVLRAHPWNFAIERQQLGKLLTKPAFDYSTEFSLPTSPYCLRVLSLEFPEQKFKVEGRKLLSNYDTAKILYIAQITDTSQFDPLFAEALVGRMAAELAYSVTGSNTLSQQMWSGYESKISEARSIDGQEGFLNSLIADTFTDFRR